MVSTRCSAGVDLLVITLFSISFSSKLTGMYKKLSQLSFVIGLFFTLVSLVLFGNAMLNNARRTDKCLHGIVFLLFGLLMIYLSNKEKKKSDDSNPFV